jgi:membrane-associated phospholipid phosphatase
MTRASLARRALFGLSGLALFSLLFSLAADDGLWPRLPAGALHGTDLIAGFAAGFGLLWLLLRPKKSPNVGSG